ncbi:hypothetical protein NL50_17475 [Clostridium acetobutylicum]|nr:hypothetical protein NL50_17475 [Clostridium acetobutylicum]
MEIEILEKIYNITHQEVKEDEIINRVTQYKSNLNRLDIDEGSIRKYLCKKYGCRNKELERIAEMCSYSWSVLNIDDIIVDKRCIRHTCIGIYLKRSYTTGSGSYGNFQYHHVAYFFPLIGKQKNEKSRKPSEIVFKEIESKYANEELLPDDKRGVLIIR